MTTSNRFCTCECHIHYSNEDCIPCCVSTIEGRVPIVNETNFVEDENWDIVYSKDEDLDLNDIIEKYSKYCQ